MLDTFDDEAEKPVSAAFGPPPPSSSTFTNPAPLTNPTQAQEGKEVHEPPSLVIDRPALSPQTSPALDHLPIMESISHDAIEEMVTAVFEIGGGDGEYMTFGQFEEVVKRDPNVLAWIESLGSVF